MLFELLFGRAWRRMLREELGHAYANQGRTLLREVRKTVATQIEAITARLQTVLAHQRKTIEEIAAAKGKIGELTDEVAKLRDIITSGQDTIPPAQLQALEDAVSAVENLAVAADAALPDLPQPGASPEEGASPDETGGSPDGGSPEASVETGSGSEPAPAPGGGDVFR